MKRLNSLLICGLAGWLSAAPLSWAATAPLTEAQKPTRKHRLGASLPEGEKAIYLRLVEAYRKGDLTGTYKFRDLMLKNYSRSVYADNALYLTGLLDYQRGRVAEAVQNFGDLAKKYPQSNKRPAALYAKSVAYSKLNLPQLSKQLLEEITKIYPGSPESQRAWMDLRIKDTKG